ncbi:CorA-like Mg2+ transporter protein [Aspergillus sclerotialis]|uniref:CorA-like Mg2+ transporter protein n=1 Tax=Aspergillus sclerotialis TaxID=2070753 RepID=A0A3A3A1T7_9EURO|nr:CorA-like Mg2+ transporter protein [Aspergillus sclerotialis]
MGQDTLQVPGSGRFEIIGSVYSTDVDIVAVPAVGADWKSAWIDDSDGRLQKPWLVSDLRRCIQTARVLLFDHGRPSEQDDFASLGQNLLTELHKERRLTL